MIGGGAWTALENMRQLGNSGCNPIIGIIALIFSIVCFISPIIIFREVFIEMLRDLFRKR